MRPISLQRGFPFFRRFAPFLDDPKRIVLVGDWNAILDPNIDRVGRGARWLGRCESSLIDLTVRHDLVERFRLHQPEREIWLDSSPSVRARSYLDRVLVRRADTDVVTCPTFHCVAQTDHRLVRIGLQLAARPSLAGYWMFSTSLQEIRDFQDQLTSLVQWALEGWLPEINGGDLLNKGLEILPSNTVASST